MEYTFSERTLKKYSTLDALSNVKFILLDRLNKTNIELPKDIVINNDKNLTLPELNNIQDYILDLNLPKKIYKRR